MRRGRATAPYPPQTAAHGAASGGRTGAAATLGERGLLKVGLPEAANNHSFFFWVSGTRALDSGQSEQQLFEPRLPSSLVFLFVLLLGFNKNHYVSSPLASRGRPHTIFKWQIPTVTSKYFAHTTFNIFSHNNFKLKNPTLKPMIKNSEKKKKNGISKHESGWKNGPKLSEI